MSGSVCCGEEFESAQILDGEGLLSVDGGGAIGEIHDALGGIGQLSDGVGEGLCGLVVSAADGVVEASEAHGSEGLILNEEERGDVASGADWFVVDGLDVEGVGG